MADKHRVAKGNSRDRVDEKTTFMSSLWLEPNDKESEVVYLRFDFTSLSLSLSIYIYIYTSYKIKQKTIIWGLYDSTVDQYSSQLHMATSESTKKTNKIEKGKTNAKLSRDGGILHSSHPTLFSLLRNTSCSSLGLMSIILGWRHVCLICELEKRGIR